MSKYLDAAAILAAKDLVTEEVLVPEWGGTVLVRVMSGDDRDEWEGEIEKMRKGEERFIMCSRLAVRSVCDETGAPVFTLEQMSALGDKSSAPLERIFDVGSRLNKLGKKKEDEVKNSDAPPGASSSSSSA